MTATDRMAEGYEPNFDIDFEVGHQGELWVARIVDALQSDRAEIKTDEKARKYGNVYLEYQCLYRGEWKNTGIAATPSEVWCHVIGEVMIAAPTEAVRATARHYWLKSSAYRKDQTRGSHPTRGVVIPLDHFIRTLVQGAPDDVTVTTMTAGDAA